jgi:chromosome segregation protein
VRLTNIKLSGFKSFADSTQLMLPGQLVGVVGPNGCGKSNIMDAVRWVLGESRASELRGESMQDVIFNGTTSRKAASRSSVELVFDNSDHRAGGQWSQFAEIAVKRVLTRDGSSSYYLNNQPVRRRDVQDVFLGTGLGPRAYAIIGQGTISRIIESKPEELRLFLEEAAGVSKYKERRRETEHRLNDTRENLTRVEDILRELNAQIERLDQQAIVAQKYNTLQKDVTTKQHQLWWLKWTEAKLAQEQYILDIQKSNTDYESKVADLRHVESEIETLRQAHYAGGDEVNQAQGKLYDASAEVGRIEAEIRFLLDARQKAQSRLIVLEEQERQWTHREQEAQEERRHLVDQLQEQALWLAQLEEKSYALKDGLPELEQRTLESQSKTHEQQQSVILLQQQIQVLAAEQRSVSEQLAQLNLRRERFQQDLLAINAPDPARLQSVQSQFLLANAKAQEAQERLSQLQEQLPVLEAQRKAAQQSLNDESSKQADLSAKVEALKNLQSSVLENGRLKPWLKKHGLEGLSALWSQLHVQEGWETAVESALRERVGSYQVTRLESVQSFDQDPPPVKVVFHELPNSKPPVVNAKLTPLMEKIHCSDSALNALLSHWLNGAYAAQSLSEAFSARSQLALSDAEFIYTPKGHVIGAQSILFYAADHEQAGVLERAQLIENLEKQLKAQHLMREQASGDLQRAESAYARANQELEDARTQTLAAQKQAHDVQVESLAVAQLMDQTRLRSEQIQSDLAEIKEACDQLEARQSVFETQFESLDMQLGDQQERHAQFQEQQSAAQELLAKAKEELQALERQQQEADFAKRSVSTRDAELERVIQTASEQLVSVVQEKQNIAEEIEGLDENRLQGSLQDALSIKLEKEQILASKRSIYDDLTAKLRASDERRLQFERALDPLRQKIQDLQLKEQAARIGVEQYKTQLDEAQADFASVEQGIKDAAVRLAGLSSEIDRLQREIQLLGAVNLAALDELTHSRERKTFLDAQTADLTEAMLTLEAAIKKIDAETRDLLGSTFNIVNDHFGRMFPELFGGGNAKLVMTGEEILDSGVQVLAQPPGKKNQTIHLLSGGEKALTAIALVFAIFQLNPAPFCLLDEVDAPLDDANTERYCKLVASMSKETQFLFISHNKIAMEMAEQLIGVTMQEQGVSRIVAVDMVSAISMVEAA